MNGVFLIPTGIGCEIGGHAGDATPAAKLIASLCDHLLIHPNVVNASDINEMTENMWYVEGSILNRFLNGEIQLMRPRMNRLLVVTNPPVSHVTINPVNAARATIGLEAEIMELDTPLEMIATTDNGCATGVVNGYKELIDQVKQYHQQYPYDAVAVHTPIEVPRDVELDYYNNPDGRVNPIGGVEARASKLIADGLGVPVAHAPIDERDEDTDYEMFHAFEQVTDPRLAAEFISNYFLQCVLKGLWRAPRIGPGLSCRDIDFIVSPFGCIGPPHQAALQQDIPVIVVRENLTCLNDIIPDTFIVVDNYMEAAGVIQSMNIGVSTGSIRRPLLKAPVYRKHKIELEVKCI